MTEPQWQTCPKCGERWWDSHVCRNTLNSLKVALAPTCQFCGQTTRAQPAQAGQVLTDEQWQCIADITESFLTRDMKDEIEAVLAKRVPQWRDIETAPKDGTRVLLVIDHGEWGDAVWTGLWADGWIVSYGKAQAAPTHWMPLPPPPGIVGKEGA